MPDIRKNQRNSLFLLFFLVAGMFGVSFVSPASAQQTEAFPRPAELEPAIRFWTRIYTEVDLDSGFLHDSHNLNVIYHWVDYDRDQIDRYQRRVREDLRILATGKRTDLTAHQQLVLDAWPDGVSNSELSAAVNRVRFQRGQSNRFLEGLIRSGAYRAHIERVTRERGLPVELAALPHVESSFQPDVYSYVNAAGMWQFMRSTGRQFMRVDNIIDERLDPYAATYAAMELLQTNYELLGSWPLALTAYNQGAGSMQRAVEQVGSNRIEDIVANYTARNFGFAGRNFYAQFLAVLDVEQQANAFFGVLNLDPAPEYEEYELEAFVEARTLADALGVSLEQLSFDNPALRPIIWEGGKRIPRGYVLKIQKKSIDGSMADRIRSIPPSQLYVAQTPDVEYIVRRGDSLSVIAQRFDTSVSQLVGLNNLASQHRIRVGQTLVLPHTTDSTLLDVASNDAGGGGGSGGSYVIRRGDTLSAIARRQGVSEAALLRVNALTNPDRIREGQVLQLP